MAQMGFWDHCYGYIFVHVQPCSSCWQKPIKAKELIYLYQLNLCCCVEPSATMEQCSHSCRSLPSRYCDTAEAAICMKYTATLCLRRKHLGSYRVSWKNQLQLMAFLCRTSRKFDPTTTTTQFQKRLTAFSKPPNIEQVFCFQREPTKDPF